MYAYVHVCAVLENHVTLMQSGLACHYRLSIADRGDQRIYTPGAFGRHTLTTHTRTSYRYERSLHMLTDKTKKANRKQTAHAYTLDITKISYRSHKEHSFAVFLSLTWSFN